MSAHDETLLKGLIQQAERAQAAGQREEAQRLLARAESISASHPLVLNARAIDLLQTGNAARARQLLEQATQRVEAAKPDWQRSKQKLGSYEVLQSRQDEAQARKDARREQRDADEHAARALRMRTPHP